MAVVRAYTYNATTGCPDFCLGRTDDGGVTWACLCPAYNGTLQKQGTGAVYMYCVEDPTNLLPTCNATETRFVGGPSIQASIGPYCYPTANLTTPNCANALWTCVTGFCLLTCNYALDCQGTRFCCLEGGTCYSGVTANQRRLTSH